MRRLICAMLAIALLLAACSVDTQPEPLEEPQDVPVESIPEEAEPPPELPDFYRELRERGSLITAAFDFEDFSVWFTVAPGDIFYNALLTPAWRFFLSAYRPLTAAVVRNLDCRYTLIEETEIGIWFQPIDYVNDWWWLDEIPDSIPQVGNQHLVQRDGYQVLSLYADVFGTGPAITVHTDEQMILIYNGRSRATSLIRQMIFTKDGIATDYTFETISGHPRILLGELESLTFSPETGVLTLENDAYTLRANIYGITETTTLAAFELLVDGELTHIDRLFDLTNHDIRFMHGDFWMDSIVHYPVINGRMYRLPGSAQASELRLDSFDFATKTKIHDQLIRDFSPEIVLHSFYAARGLTVYTDVAAYLFDCSFELLNRVHWPEYVLTGIMPDSWRIRRSVAFNDDFTKLAFTGTINDICGLYLLDLTTDVPPVLLQERVPVYQDYIGEDLREWPSPVLFVEGNRLFVSVVIWEGVAFFRLVDFDGNVLEEFPGGLAFPNKSMVTFVRDSRQDEPPHYFDFESGTLSPIDWRLDEYEAWTAYISDPNNPRIWYVSSMLWREHTRPRVLERSSIQRLDFENKTAVPILTAAETQLTLMSVSPNGELVFAYSDHVSSGFAVFTPTE